MESTHISMRAHTRTECDSVREICEFFTTTYSEMLRCEHPNDQFDSVGRTRMMEQVAYWVRNRKAIRCLIPAFPMKSPSKLKVGGRLGDLGEALALERLDEFAHAIGQRYEPGCRVLIVSDGRVYADLAGRTVDDVRDFNTSIRRMANPRYIRFTELNLLDESGTNEYTCLDDSEEEQPIHLLRRVSSIAEDRTIDVLMEEYGVSDEEVDQAIKSSENLTAVYRGFIRFMMVDGLPWQSSEFTSRKQVERLAKATARKMIGRNMAYARRMEEKYPNYVRFSIHGHDNSKKFSVRLYETVEKCVTPWHNVTCEMLDGRHVAMKKVVVDLINRSISRLAERDIPVTHPVDKKYYTCFEEEANAFDGWTPSISARKFVEVRTDDDEFWCFREVERTDESEYWTNLDVTFARASPDTQLKFNGLIIQSHSVSPPSMMEIPVDSLRRLVHRHGTVILRGFERIEDEKALEECVENLGEVVEAGTNHEVFPDVPMFQFFHCLEEHANELDVSNGKTMIVDTRTVLKECSNERECDVVLRGPFGTVLKHSAVSAHPISGENILRFVCKDDENRELTELDGGDLEWFRNELVPVLIEDGRFVYSHDWERNDFMVMDNLSQLNWRSTPDGMILTHICFN